MAQVIIYNQDNGVPAVIIPAPEALSFLSIDDIAKKDVPFGKPYKIMEYANLPLSEPRESWEVVDIDLTDGLGADYGAGSQNVVKGWNKDGSPIVEGLVNGD